MLSTIPFGSQQAGGGRQQAGGPPCRCGAWQPQPVASAAVATAEAGAESPRMCLQPHLHRRVVHRAWAKARAAPPSQHKPEAAATTRGRGSWAPAPPAGRAAKRSAAASLRARACTGSRSIWIYACAALARRAATTRVPSSHCASSSSCSPRGHPWGASGRKLVSAWRWYAPCWPPPAAAASWRCKRRWAAPPAARRCTVAWLAPACGSPP